MKQVFVSFMLMMSALGAMAIDHPGITHRSSDASRFTLINNNTPNAILIDADEDAGIRLAANNLQQDFFCVCGNRPDVVTTAPSADRMIIVGSLNSRYIKQIAKRKLIDLKELKGKTEKYIMTIVANPLGNGGEALVIAGSDKRGTIYGIYELSEQIGVSPWYWWADAPIAKASDLSIERGKYTAGEPAVRYRGIFLNDEAPCLTTWVKNTFGTGYGGHEFYAKVFELLLRLRANYMWPAMWSWSFYADDPENSKTADMMGIMMGTSHHEPMARNHQEWARHRKEYGVWDYATNKDVIDRFFREGMERSKDNEDIITIGMRSDGDTAMGGKEGHDDEYVSEDEKNMALLHKIIDNQRRIIAEVTGQKAEKRQQVWALYKEVQHYYDLGFRVPEDVIMLLSDDNWGDARWLPSPEERKHKGGWGMYYHVDYVGAPRNSKWMNVTPTQNLWEQMTLTYEYGVDKLWVLNVGDLKPMEYPITLFLNMAWNPTQYDQNTLTNHTQKYFKQLLGVNDEMATEAARLYTLSSKYNGRVTAEMLNKDTYNVNNGEWRNVVGDFKSLETDALRLFADLPVESHDAYRQLVLFPIQAMCNVYEMYYAQAMNHKLYNEGNAEANLWADRCEAAFKRDSVLCADYNKKIAGGKWDGMMIQKHIGYTSWNDNFPADVCPKLLRFDAAAEDMQGGYTFAAQEGRVVIEAPHYYSLTAPKTSAQWTLIDDMGRTKGAMTLRPYTEETNGAAVNYRFNLPKGVSKVKVHVITKSTLPFRNPKGHTYGVSLDNKSPQTVNFNGNLNENPENVYSIYYPTVSSRIVEKVVELDVTDADAPYHILSLLPYDPAILFEKIVIDWGGYDPSFLFMDESPCKR